MDSTNKDRDLNIMRKEVKINIPTTSGHMFKQTPLPNLPRAELLDGSREEYLRVGVPLYEASISGDWAAAKVILEGRPELVRYAITENYDTILHIAVSAEDTKRMTNFVGNLVSLMEKQDLELQNKNYNTPFCLAAAAGNVKMAKIMVHKNRALHNIPGTQGMMPLYMSALFGKHDMVRYLYGISSKMSGDFWRHESQGLVVWKCVEADMFDVAIQILNDRPEIAGSRNVCGDVLRVLAENPNAFSRTEENIIWRIINSFFAIIRLKVGVADYGSDALILLRIIRGNIMTMPKERIDLILRGPPDLPHIDGKIIYSSRPLFIAAEMGNTRFIIELVRAYPDLIWKQNDDGLSIFHIAVMHRHQGIFNLLYEIGPMKELIIPLKDNDDNNMLHLVGKTAKQMRHQAVSGASLLMQRELLWFKEVEKMVPPSYRKRKNKDGLTPYELFSENNKDLVSQGLKWMKDCMVVTTLIVTVAFAVAFTVPGGYDQDKGFPMFIHEGAFLVFVIADAISLFSSSASLLVFLSILTSRYGERDFLYSLPRRLMTGLVTLFISVTAMMVTFGASFFVLYRSGLAWVPFLVCLFAVIPVLLFAVLQYPVFVDMFRSTYDANYLINPKRRVLYNPNPKF